MRFRISALWLAVIGASSPTFASRAAACVPYADAVVAWDVDADLYVVATYHERATPPASRTAFPNLLELRRISSGKQVGVVNCAAAPGAVGAAAARGPCDFRALFGSAIPRSARFVAQGKPLPPGRLRIAALPDPSDGGLALFARTPAGGRHQVRWLGNARTQTGETLSFRLGASERRADVVVVALESRYRGGGCERTEAKLLRFHPRELDAKPGPEQQAGLLAALSLSSPFEDWRSAADIAPLPPEKLVFGMVVAAEAGRQDLAARWWTQGTATLPLERVASLAAALRARPELEVTRQLITLPPEPEPAR
ncbi:MAG TPA: hypothetical protein VGG33_09800 [Polyangia bacterium]